MLTIVAIDKNLMSHLDDFDSLFTEPSEKGNFKLCSWNRDGKNLSQAIPALFDRHFVSDNDLREWNIVIVSDDRNCDCANPFSGDYMSGRDSLPDPELNEVAKMLGIVPTSSHSSYELPNDKFGKIKWNVEVNRSLRDEKIRQYKTFEFARPQKIYLLSVVRKADVDLDEFSSKKTDKIFFDFRIKARYPVNCRFLRFNLSSISNSNTKEDFFRLWMTLLTFIYSGPDLFYLSADALYNIDSLIDKKDLKNQIDSIYSRVHFVKKYAQNRISDIIKERERLKSKHYEKPSLAEHIDVVFSVDEKGLYLNKKKFGLAKNCPCDDRASYASQRELIEKKIATNLFKTPNRALKKAIKETKEKGRFVPFTEEKIFLDENQTEDLIESINNTELSLYGDSAVDISYKENSKKARLNCDKDNYKIMKKRSTVANIVGGSLIAFCAVLIGFLPYVINAVTTEIGTTIKASLGITFGSIILLALVGFITILIQKIPLTSGINRFQSIIKRLIRSVTDSAKDYSLFLSKLSTFMKSNSFKTYLDYDGDIYKREEELMLQKNIDFSEKEESACISWGEIFDFQIKYNEKKVNKLFSLDEFPEKNPVFSFKLQTGDFKTLLNGKESNLITPYNFVKSVNISLEEDA